MPEYSYRIEVHFFDHTTQTESKGAKKAFDTSTGLPSSLDSFLKRHASQSHLFLPKDFWKPLPSTRELSAAAASFESPVDVTKKLAPWAAVPQTLPREQAVTKSTNAIVDFRFGPLTVDWVDNPQQSRFIPASPLSTTMSLSPSGASEPSSYLSAKGKEASTSSWHDAETSGSTDLYWGTVHLFREAGATESIRRSEKEAAVKQDDGRQLGMVSVPGNLSAANILTFIAPALDSIAQVRVLKDSSPNRQIVLLRFRDAQSAAEFKRMYQGRTYHDSPESEVCHVVSISSVKLKTSTTPPFSFPWSTHESDTGAAAELPTCPVCLERLDANVTGLMQTSCTHTFHCSCLLKWGDSRCPICRATNFRTRRPTLSTPAAAVCSTCKSNANLWMCTICGNVGCGRYQGGHAAKHYEESGHLYSLELETQRVWDYAGDMYVHRLIRSRTDGKVVELPSQFSRTGLDSTSTDKGGASGPGKTDEESQDKIEAMGIEYANLMSSQLEAQRVYWEEEVARYKDECAVFKRRWEEALQERAKWRKEKSELEKRIEALEKAVEDERATATGRIEAMQRDAANDEARRKKERTETVKTKKELEKELKAERAVTASLSKNLAHVRDEVAQRDEEMKATRAQVDELTEQMRDVMFALSARDTIDAQGGSNELQGGSISLPPSAPSPSATSRRRKKK